MLLSPVRQCDPVAQLIVTVCIGAMRRRQQNLMPAAATAIPSPGAVRNLMVTVLLARGRLRRRHCYMFKGVGNGPPVCTGDKEESPTRVAGWGRRWRQSGRIQRWLG